MSKRTKKGQGSQTQGSQTQGSQTQRPENHKPEKNHKSAVSKIDLRTAPPVQRMRLVLGKLFEGVGSHLTKLSDWAEKNPAAQKAYAVLLQIADLSIEFDTEMVEFEKTGWSPPRKSYTAKTNEGDRVAVLEDMRDSCAELMDPKLMGDLLVVKKYPGNKGGGLVVEAKDGSKMKVSISHVVKLSSAV